jgi:integrating conjugative element protein (TIGR03756 family)
MKRMLIATSFCLLSFGLANTACAAKVADTVNTATITKFVVQAATTDPMANFLNYRVIGSCEWLVCYGPFCSVDTTLKVNQFLPDAVVSVFNEEGSNPWVYANKLVDPVMKKIGDKVFETMDGVAPSATDDSIGSTNNMMEKFKEVDVIGDPALAAMFSHSGHAFIRTHATEYEPYYSSLADAYLWRSPQLDDLLHPEDLLPGVRTEGSLLDEWGNIMPRVGYINQLGDYKAAAVIALRGADIATNPAQTHIYNSLPSGSCGYDCIMWPSHENDFMNVKYQEIYPVPTVIAKPNFGADDMLQATTYNQDQYSLGRGNYVFVMWRHYRGCIQHSGTFLWST